ncbi:MAG TPA: type II secretion system protein [Gemmatimonadales bacterium]|jgi:prepilin-type N-terminal cleavage/methylation domain-containing protein|nr:type II secretion system protein [Gemmatimonadales bacterium]
MTDHTNRQTGALPRPRYYDRRGFTLIEALTVIVIIGLMVGIAIPRSGVSTYRANSGAQVVTSALIYAQRQAISRQADTRVAFDVANNELRIHEDSTNDNIINFNERVTATALPEGMTFGRGAAPARAMGGATVNFTRTQGLLPIVVFHRDGTANENGGVYLTTIDGLSVGRTADVRAVEVTRATGRAVWFSYATGAWKEGH